MFQLLVIACAILLPASLLAGEAAGISLAIPVIAICRTPRLDILVEDGDWSRRFSRPYLSFHCSAHPQDRFYVGEMERASCMFRFCPLPGSQAYADSRKSESVARSFVFDNYDDLGAGLASMLRAGGTSYLFPVPGFYWAPAPGGHPGGPPG